ncbi:MAG: GNAT family N-acetyltransferase [Acidimicrobiales bacterium]
MVNVEIEVVRESRRLAECEALFADYVDGVLERLATLYAIAPAPDQATRVHEGFRAEWPALSGPRGRLLLARVDSAPAGVAALLPVDDLVAEVKRVYVVPSARGRGVARLLLERVIDDARGLGYLTLRLESHRYMTAAIALYRSLGFVDGPAHEGFEGANYGLGDVTVFLTRDLTRA